LEGAVVGVEVVGAGGRAGVGHFVRFVDSTARVDPGRMESLMTFSMMPAQAKSPSSFVGLTDFGLFTFRV